MALPEYLDDPFKYSSLDGVTDVADIITEFRAVALSETSPTWTEPSTGLFRTPTDAAGRWFDILLTATSATILTVRMRDSAGTTVREGRIYIEAGGSKTHIVVGAHFYDILTELTAGHEYATGGVFDMYPESQGSLSVPYQHYGKTFRSTSGTAESSYSGFYAYIWGTSSYGNRMAFWATNMNRNTGSSIMLVSPYSGANLYFQIHGTCYDNNRLGCVYNHVYGNSDIPAGSIINVTVGGVPIQLLASRMNTYGFRIFVRIA